MSPENVQLIEALYPSPATDIAALFRDEDSFARLQEGLSPFMSDDFESVMIFLGETRTYRGLEGFRQNWLDWLAPWASYRTAIDELIDVGDRVLLLLRDRARLEGTEAEVELVGASICTIRDGRIARWEDYADRAKALQAAGLSQ